MSRATVIAALLLAAQPGLAQTPAKAPSPAAPASSKPAVVSEAVIETAEGEIVVRLLADVAPLHVKHFVSNAKAGRYDGTAFHRIIRGGIVQGGDPLSKDPKLAARYGTGGLGVLKAEFSERPFARGAVGAARLPSSKDSGGSQFFICLREQPALTGQYTLFGEVVSGMDVADKLGDTPTEGDRPKARVEIRRVTIREASSPAS